MSLKRMGKVLILVIIALIIATACNLPNKQPKYGMTPTIRVTTTKESRDVTPETTTSEPSIVPTREPFYVAPVTSPTNELTQDIVVYVGNGTEVTVVTESGTFTVEGEFNAYGNPAVVTINLLPNTIHHLQVTAKNKLMENCTGTDCGGTNFETFVDQNGNPLVIIQGEPQMLQPGSVISPENARNLVLLGTIQPAARMTDLSFYDNTTLTSVGYAPGISLWNVTDGSLLRTLGYDTISEAIVTTLSSDQQTIAIGGTASDSMVRIMSIDTGEIREFGTHETYISSLAFNPDGSLLASSSNDNTVRVWNVSTGEQIIQFEGDVENYIQEFSCLFWQDAKTLAAIGSQAIYWWDISSGSQVKRVSIPEEVSFMVSGDFRSDGQQIATAAQDDNLYIYDVSGDEWHIIPANLGINMNTVTYSPDGSLLAYGSYNYLVTLWDVQSETRLISLDVLTDTVADVTFSPDSKYLAVLGWEGPIWLWGVP